MFIDFYWFPLVSVDFYWFLLISTDFQWYVLISIDVYWFLIISIDLFIDFHRIPPAFLRCSFSFQCFSLVFHTVSFISFSLSYTLTSTSINCQWISKDFPRLFRRLLRSFAKAQVNVNKLVFNVFHNENAKCVKISCIYLVNMLVRIFFAHTICRCLEAGLLN